MPPEPVPADPRRDEDPARYAAEPEGPWWEEEEWEDYDDDYAEAVAESREAAEDQARADAIAARLGTTAALAAVAASLGRRGPGQPGSAEIVPGEYPGPAAQFATGMLMDVMPGGPELARFADEAVGPDDVFDGVSDDELLGVLCAWDRVAAHATARKYAAVAELVRRRPAPGHAPQGEARMPQVWDEFTASELCAVLAQSRHDADGMLGLAHDLEVKLPGTLAAFRDGVLDEDKVMIIARAVAVLDPAEARAAEALVLGRAGRLTPAGLRSAIARAVIEVAPDKARKRREQAAREARVERWAEVSGNAGLAGRELPAAQVFAADQKITAWARQLKQAGLAGSLDELRAQAYLDLLLTNRAGKPASVMARRSAASTTGSSRTRSGRSSSFPTARSGGPPRPGAAASPNPLVTRSSAAHQETMICAATASMLRRMRSTGTGACRSAGPASGCGSSTSRSTPSSVYCSARARSSGPATTSTLASSLARITGLRSGSTMIPLATLILLVWAATSVNPTIVSRRGSVGGIVKPGGAGSGSTTCSPVHTDSNPAASACRATRTASSGSAQVP